MARKPTRQDRQRLADPSTYAIFDEAIAKGRARYGALLDAIFTQMQAFLAGRNPKNLKGDDYVRYTVLKSRFDTVAIEEKRFIEAEAAERLDPRRDGSETVA